MPGSKTASRISLLASSLGRRLLCCSPSLTPVPRWSNLGQSGARQVAEMSDGLEMSSRVWWGLWWSGTSLPPVRGARWPCVARFSHIVKRNKKYVEGYFWGIIYIQWNAQILKSFYICIHFTYIATIHTRYRTFPSPRSPLVLLPKSYRFPTKGNHCLLCP